MHRTLIVARFDPADAEQVAEVFAESDRTELPHLVGVSRRTLFSFHDLYFHLIEATGPDGPDIGAVRDHPLFADVNAKLAPYIDPYAPDWSEPRDAMAQPFYQWSAGAGGNR